MASELAKLLSFIVDNTVKESETKELELNATAVQDLDEEIVGITEEHRADADRLSPFFEEGIRQAARGGGKVTVDDTDTMGNGIAEAFARFLVTTNLATSQTEDLSENHYRYNFELNWDRLKKIAQRAGIDLDAATRSA